MKMNAYTRGFLAEAARLGIVDHDLDQRRKSIKYTGRIAGKIIVYYLAITPSDTRRALHNAVAELRRLVRTVTGNAPEPKPKLRCRHRKRRFICTPQRSSPPSLTPSHTVSGRPGKRAAAMQTVCSAYGTPPPTPNDLLQSPWAALAPLLRRLQASYPTGNSHDENQDSVP